jgi:nitric oxide reductase NorD protein
MSSSRGIVLGDDELKIIDDDSTRPLAGDIAYDEWNADAGAYIRRGAIVRLYEPELGDREWAVNTLHSHAALVRRVKTQFERLRARRTLFTRQASGDDLDVAACVDAIVDRRVGQSPDDRLYLDARPARRGLALALLADASGSTEAGVNAGLRIIDLEKIALLLAGEALDALGDLYAVYAFAGRTASNVKVTTVKDFSERSGDTVRSRIAGLSPSGFTRLGAAVRHATHQLARQSAGHRLLLILSDGRPNDVDQYQGQYGVEDSRQAIMEARASGVYPFCLTVDRDASEYLPRIFGKSGHTILQRPEQLPTALLGVVRALIRRP